MTSRLLLAVVLSCFGCADQQGDSADIALFEADDKKVESAGLGSATGSVGEDASMEDATGERLGACYDAFEQCVRGCGQMNDPCHEACDIGYACCLGADRCTS